MGSRRHPYHINVAFTDPALRTLFQHYATSERRSNSEAGQYLIMMGLRYLYEQAAIPLPVELRAFYEKPPKNRIGSPVES